MENTKKTVTLEYDVWEMLIKYRIAMKHGSMSETLKYLFKRVKEVSK
jgi:macrodomain Ter protein organizer (MatP/YcbG family)